MLLLYDLPLILHNVNTELVGREPYLVKLICDLFIRVIER
jgi:hypothetical protein